MNLCSCMSFGFFSSGLVCLASVQLVNLTCKHVPYINNVVFQKYCASKSIPSEWWFGSWWCDGFSLLFHKIQNIYCDYQAQIIQINVIAAVAHCWANSKLSVQIDESLSRRRASGSEYTQCNRVIFGHFSTFFNNSITRVAHMVNYCYALQNMLSVYFTFSTKWPRFFFFCSRKISLIFSNIFARTRMEKISLFKAVKNDRQRWIWRAKVNTLAMKMQNLMC